MTFPALRLPDSLLPALRAATRRLAGSIPARQALLYAAVVAGAAAIALAGIGLAYDQAARHVASSGLAVKARSLRSVPPTPMLAASDLHSTRLGPAVVAGAGALAPPPPAAAAPPPADAVEAERPSAVADAAVNVRAGPSKQSPRLFTLADGEAVQVAGSRRGWVEVIRHDGRSGWVYSGYLVPRGQ